jgi:prepilin-type N-terminal cleavage/methylation domain-containing protein
MNRYLPPPTRTHEHGLTLIELAVAVVVLGLILGSILTPLATQIEQRRIADARRQLDDIKEALVGFALAQAKSHLPCPDRTSGGTPPNIANDGIEDVTGGTCDVAEGNLPWATLGLGGTDPWGNRYRYRVTTTFARRAPGAAFTLASQGDLLVCSAVGACGPGQALTVLPPSDNSPVAVIVSHGPNGWGAINAATGTANVKPRPPAPSVDEAANYNGDATFVSRVQTADDGSNPALSREFDDVVVWLSPHTLKHRLVAAGKLP